MPILKKRIRGNKTYYYVASTASYKGQKKTFEKYIGNDQTLKNILDKKKAYYSSYLEIKCNLYSQYLQIIKTKLYHLDQDYSFVLVLIQRSYHDFLSSLYPSELEKYQQEFNVRYIHNTTAIEGNTLTLKETALIIDAGISPRSKKLREIFEIENYNRILQYVRNYNKDISLEFILKIHGLIQRNIDDNTAGFLRRIEVGISGSEWKPPPAILVKDELFSLIQWYNINIKKLHPIELAGLFHHRFLQIHPFVDGNGRVARELFNFILRKNDFPPIIIPVAEREEYMKLLEIADREDGGVVPLLEFFLKITLIDYSNVISNLFQQLAKQNEVFETIPEIVKVDFNELYQWFIKLIMTTMKTSINEENIDVNQLDLWHIFEQIFDQQSQQMKE